MIRNKLLSASLSLIILMSVSACADVPTDPQARAEYEATNDPFEPTNRVIFDVNDFMDRLIWRPMAELYRVIIPPYFRDRVADGVSNFKEPVVAMNNALQGEFTNAGTTLGRLVVNSTLGIGGLWDVATDFGLKQQDGDFGQTLYVWGFHDSGPYLVLPLFGPSNVRDGIGLGVDSVASPWQYLAGLAGPGTENKLDISFFLGDGIVRREQSIEAMDALREGSVDFYAQMRSVTRQYRDNQLGIMNSPKFDE